MGRILYHYTDFSALAGIITKAELRVNNVLNMNDASEMTFFLNRVIDEISKGLSADMKKKLEEESRKYEDSDYEPQFKHSAYAACFSLYEDDAAQWERYGNRGRGVGIGFDEDTLRKLMVPGLSLENVYYNSDEKSKEVAGEFFRLMNNHEKEIIEDRLSDEIVKAYEDLIMRACMCSAAYKHPSFVCENEVRLIFWPEVAKLSDVSPGYHVTAERIKKYYPLNLKMLCDRAGISFEDLFVTIKIGPESTQSPDILADFFCDSGFAGLAEKIVKSKCPLRSALKG